MLIACGELQKNNTEFLLGKLESDIKYTTIEGINQKGLQNFIQCIKEDIRNISSSLSGRGKGKIVINSIEFV